MELEKEVRFSISKEQIESIKSKTAPYKGEEEMLDITCGYDGFNSLSKWSLFKDKFYFLMFFRF